MPPAGSAATNKIPAVVYGHGNDPMHLTLPGHSTMMALKHGGANALLELDIDGKPQLALAREVQVDPLRRVLEHIDFVAVRKGEKVTVDVPVHVVGDAVSETLVVTENATVQVEAEATNIPEYIEVSVEGAEVGTQIHASDLDLPEGTTLLVDPETLVVNVTQAQSAESLEAELAEAEADAGITHEVSDEDAAAEGDSAEGGSAEGDAASGRGRLRRVRLPRRPGWLRRRPSPSGADATGTGDRAGDMAGGDVWLVVGLGNPGPTYAGHRHNVGYLVTSELADRMGAPFRAHKSGRADVVEGRLGTPGSDGPRIVLVRARTYMNESGGAVKQLASFYKVPPERIVAVHDELDLPFDTMRVKLGGGDNGHNGVRSMRSALGTGDFYRVRIGIGRPSGRQDVSDFVLSNYSATERKLLPLQVVTAADAVESLVTRGARAHPVALQLLTALPG